MGSGEFINEKIMPLLVYSASGAAGEALSLPEGEGWVRVIRGEGSVRGESPSPRRKAGAGSNLSPRGGEGRPKCDLCSN